MKFTSALTLILFTIGLLGCSEDQVEAEKKEVVRPVKLHTVTKANYSIKREYPAIVKAATSSDIAFEVGGRITELEIKESQDVKKGSVLAKVDTRNVVNQLNSLQSQYDNAKVEYDRASNLFKQDAIAKTVVDQRKTQLDVLKSQLDTARKSLTDSTLTAPFDGVVAAIHVKKFQNIQAQQKVATIISEGRLEAVINVPANFVSQIPRREKQTHFISFDIDPNRSIEAVFVEANLQADESTQTYQVTFGFDGPEDLLILPGMNATLTVNVKMKQNTNSANLVKVPLSAIQSSEGEQFVWLINSADMTAKKQLIVVTDSIGNEINVIEGLNEGDVIAATGAAYLTQGMKVKEWK